MPAATRDIAADITATIIARLEAGTAPWKRPWSLIAECGRPLRHEGIEYTGINALPTPPEKTATYLQCGAGFRNGFSGSDIGSARYDPPTVRKPFVFFAIRRILVSSLHLQRTVFEKIIPWLSGVPRFYQPP